MFFKNSFRIFKCDLKKLARNWVAIVIACGVALLPSLYAWINILASWDPYGNTGGVKVGIVNNDEGSQIQGININIGSELESQLKENKKLGWTFFDNADEGIEQCRNGKVYATIIIPNDFSAKMATLLDETHVKPQLDYYVNEKINAIAPKMTDSGASTLQKQITQSFIQTVIEKVFEVLNPLGYDIDQHYDEIEKFQSLLNLVDDDLPHVLEKLDNLLASAKDGKIDLGANAEDVEFLKRVLTNAITYTDDVKADTDKLMNKTDHSASDIRTNIDGISSALASMESSLDNLNGKITTNKPDVSDSLLSLTADIDAINNRLSSMEKEITIFDDDTRTDLERKIQRLRTTLGSLDDFLDDVSEAGDVISTLAKDLKFIEDSTAEIGSNVKDLSDSIDKAFDEIIDALEKISGKASSAETEIAAVGAKLNHNSSLYRRLEKAVSDAKGQDAAIAELKLSTQIDNIINKIENKHDRISEKLDKIEDTASGIQLTSKSLRTHLTSFNDSAQILIRNLHKQISESDATLKEINSILKRSNDDKILNFSEDIATISNKLASLSSNISKLEGDLSGSTDLESTVDAAKSICQNTRKLTESLSKVFDGSLDEKIQKLLSNANSAGSDLQQLFSMSIDGVDSAQEFLDKLNNSSTILTDDVNKFKDKLPAYLGGMTKIADKIRALSDVIDLKDIAGMMQYDSEATGDFFASPVELNTTKLFPVKNYGAGLTPFYTTLCLWVGVLLMCALFTTRAANADFEYTPNEEFMGKFMLFGAMAVIQGFIAALGDVVVLRVEIMHPILFICLSMLYSLVFTGIVYTLVSLFDNVGKAIGVVFLVFQIAGAGGTFPIQVTPVFFQRINAFLPFTYAINGMREAVAGIVMGNLVTDIAVLVAYFAGFIALGLLLKRFASKALKKFLKQLSDSGVIGH